MDGKVVHMCYSKQGSLNIQLYEQKIEHWRLDWSGTLKSTKNIVNLNTHE